MSLISAETVVLSPPSVRTRPMDARLVYWAVTSALAGFLFGFDTVVISGAEQTIQSVWGLSPGVHGIAMGAALYGTVVGSLIGGGAARPVGRPAPPPWGGVRCILSPLRCALPRD